MAALVSLDAVMCFEFGSFGVWSDALNVVLVHILRLADEGNEALTGLAADDLLVHVEEAQDGAIFGILGDMEVTEVVEYVGEVLGSEVCALSFFELEMNDVLVLFLEVKSYPVWLLWIHGVAGASTTRILSHHNFIPIRSEELMLHIYRSSLQVLRIHEALRIICLLPSGASLRLLYVPILCLLIKVVNFHEFQYEGIAISSHVGVVGSLVVVTQ